MRSSFLISTALILALLACKKEDADVTKPSITTFALNGEEEEVVVNAGDPLAVLAKLSDNKSLGQFKIDIHDDFDGHTHGKTMAAWDTLIIENLSGTYQELALDIPVPTWATAGMYHGMARLIDASGNEADFKTMKIIIKNGLEPQIDVTDPDFGGQVTFTRGMSYAIKGTVTDDAGLDEIIIYLEEYGHSQKTAEEPLFEFDVDLGGSTTSWDFQTDGNITIAIPAGAEIGDYVLKVIAKDVDGNYGIFEGEVSIQ